MSTHTPTPWHAPGLGEIHDASHNEIAAAFPMVGDAEAGEIVEFPFEANAEHIVRCVNSHDALVAALRLVLRGLDSGAVKSKGYIMDFSDLNVESIPMQSLRQVIDAALMAAEATS